MEFRDYKNIVPYGFLLFLIVSGILSIIGYNDMIRKSVNSLSIPVFLFSIAILLSKSNYYIRKNAFEEAYKSNVKLANAEDEDNPFDFYKKLNTYALMVKRIDCIDKVTKIINSIAILCFAICPLTMVGIIPFPSECGYINVFSLALVYFDFFILDDVLQKVVHLSKNKIDKEAEMQAKEYMEDNSAKTE